MLIISLTFLPAILLLLIRVVSWRYFNHLLNNQVVVLEHVLLSLIK